MIFLFLTLFSSVSWSQDVTTPTTVFRCQSQHSIFDPNFQQGDETFIDLHYNADTQKLSLTASSLHDSGSLLFNSQDNTSTRFNTLQSTGSIFWQTDLWQTQVQMVYLGGPWGLAVKVPDSHPNPRWSGLSIEVYCRETKNTQEFLDHFDEKQSFHENTLGA